MMMEGMSEKRARSSRTMTMANYRILYFSTNRLERWEEFEADTFVAAVQIASSRAGDEPVELWSEQGRIASFRPRRHPGRS
jgi:hypothetical protein